MSSSQKHPILKQAIEERSKQCAQSNPQWIIHVFQSLGVQVRAQRPKDEIR
jgi:hypothetical protein